MHKEYVTMCEIVSPTYATGFFLVWRRIGLQFDFPIPMERMQGVFSGLMDVLRKEDFETPNTQDPDFRRGARLAESVRRFAALHGIELWHRDFQLFAKQGRSTVPCLIRSIGLVRYGRPDYDGEHHSRGFFLSPKGTPRGDGASGSPTRRGSATVR